MHAIDSTQEQAGALEAPLFASSWLALFRLLRGGATAVDRELPAPRARHDSDLPTDA